MLGLTAVFEMVTGVSPAPWAPTIILLSSNTSVDVHQTELITITISSTVRWDDVS